MIPGSVTSPGCDMNLVPVATTTTTTSSTRKNGLLMCSQQSILSAMERFVKSINNMDATVLVPSKLRDMDIVGLKQQQRNIPTTLNTNTELHNFYLMLNDVKKELLWGTCSIMSAASSSTSNPNSNTTTNTSHHSEFVNNNQQTTTATIFNRSISVASSTGCTNKPSSTSSSSDECLGSLGSGSISSNASDTESDADSMMTDRDTPLEQDSTSHLFVAFRHHLQGLNSILNQLADSADYLSTRYQEEIEDSSTI